ncbi:uncharacterized protein LOC123010419 isoform X2 [Tribolium madens]|uniref:uncharacterized protein LOC123010419 isoform X2 n=1 Tax=Tribolium madens TaxID=41895 RepID=UPI001CF75BB9|nr:uncharacterized protein LOC123010419 isoform X2 [Tribolium madens]
MDIRVVALERQETETNSVYGSAGIMIDNKYVIITANIVSSLIDSLKNCLGTITERKIYPFHDSKTITEFKIFWKGDNINKYNAVNGRIFAVFSCENLRLFLRRISLDWSLDTPKSGRVDDIILSIFFVIRINEVGTIDGFKHCLKQWWNLIKNEDINQMDDIFVKSVAFGNKMFLDSYSRGIVSSTVGRNNCLIVSDCALTPGSEGSPVYKNHSKITSLPFGIVVSALSWWKGDWTGLTLILDIRSVLAELFQSDYQIMSKTIHHRVLGEKVYAAGFALFSKTISTIPMISKGYIIQCNESMMRTTCCVNPGMSGGTILNQLGEIVAVIVCNSRLNGLVYPKFNMAIPYSAIRRTLHQFIKSNDSSMLNSLHSDDPKITSSWKTLTAKL